MRTRRVVKGLQRRGILRTEYSADTYRDNLGLDRPTNRRDPRNA
ncbi:hypothetical protein [Zestomonas insulae]|nr:hypothetical protein [Pseudomonas insulae]